MAFDLVGMSLDLIADYGLYAIFFLLIADGAMLLPGFPGEVVLIMAVAMFATDPAGLITLIILTSVAALLGSMLLYAILRAGGAPLVERFPRLFMMNKKKREKMERTFRRPLGQSLVFFLRLFPLTRVLVSIPAGLAKMPFVRFVVMSALGLILFHAGFLWLAYEFNRPESDIANQAALWREAYASPAMTYVEANSLIVILVLVALGIVLSIRGSIRMARDPEEGGGSLIGSLATAALIWGGLALAAGLYMDRRLVFDVVARGGIDLQAIVGELGDPATFLFAVAIVSVLLGLLLRSARKAAKGRREYKRAVAAAIEAGVDPEVAKQRVRVGPRPEVVGPPPKARTRLKSVPAGTMTPPPGGTPPRGGPGAPR